MASGLALGRLEGRHSALAPVVAVHLESAALLVAGRVRERAHRSTMDSTSGSVGVGPYAGGFFHVGGMQWFIW